MSDVLAITEKRFRVPFKSTLALSDVQALHGKHRKQPASRVRPELDMVAEQIGELQETLHADASQALLLVFQGVDAAGKDSTIHKVFTRSDPLACRVSAFKEPRGEEAQHDFLWRCSRVLPRYGEIGIFNRSYYESVLTERVHPEFLIGHKHNKASLGKLWEERYQSMREFERHLSRNGVTVVKFWLHVTKERQAERLLKRIEKPNKRWKFSCSDVYERDHWDDYMQAYLDAVNATSTSWAPWYVIPADHKPSLQLAVARITLMTLQRMKLAYPVMDNVAIKNMEAMQKRLLDEKRNA